MVDNTVPPLPHIAIQVFTETQPVAMMVEESRLDRRMARTHMKVQTGGIAAALGAYRDAPTPNVVVIETVSDSTTLLTALDELAGYCDEGTRVVVIGHVNDVPLYRELMRRGVSEYLVAPIGPLDFIEALAGIFRDPEAKPVGRAIAVIGAKGGIGASTIAHNLAYSIAGDMEIDTCIVDLDMAFGTAGLNFNIDPPQGILDAVIDPSRVDTIMIERLFSKVTPHLSLMAAPSTVERTYDFNEANFEPVMDALRASIPAIIYDVPHQWTNWTRTLLTRADEVVVVASPDLANLRNAKNLIDNLAAARPNDPKPRLVLSMVGMPKRPELAIDGFTKTLECPALASIPFDAAIFGAAANNGQMLADMQGAAKLQDIFREIAFALMGRQNARPTKKSLFDTLRERLNSLPGGKSRAA
ncbi:MAG: AAA family ATPase [Proteobacteria bacterium]|nr:AAA family ATPase [Pseudomonadota bacterium]